MPVLMMNWKASFMSQIRCHKTLVHISDDAVHQAMLSRPAFVTKELPNCQISFHPSRSFHSRSGISLASPPTLPCLAAPSGGREMSPPPPPSPEERPGTKYKVQSSYIALPIGHWHTKRHSRQSAWYNVK